MEESRRGSDVYNGDTGEFITAADAQERTRLYREFEEERLGLKPDQIRKAEFFGGDRINRLLSQPDCVGVRIYYGMRYEDADGNPASPDKGELKPRLIIVGTRADGSDIFEDLLSTKDKVSDGEALANGSPCPPHCTQ